MKLIDTKKKNFNVPMFSVKDINMIYWSKYKYPALNSLKKIKNDTLNIAKGDVKNIRIYY